MTHLALSLAVGLAVAALSAVILALAQRSARVRSEERHLAGAASREFEGAKPALIHACDAAVDKMPDDLNVAALEAKALPDLTSLLVRLLGANPLLGAASPLLVGLLPTAFAALPKTLDVSGYKTGLKDRLHHLISEARL